MAAAGDVGVASTDGALIVFDLRSGTELHQVALGSYDAQVTSLAVSPLAKQALPPPAEGPMQLRHEGQRLRRQDSLRVLGRGRDLDPGRLSIRDSTSCSLSRRC